MNTAIVVPVLLQQHPPRLCRQAYPGHPKGCPKTRRCATIALPLHEISNPPYVAVWEDFDLATHAARMLAKHPHWTDRQCRNSLYWQGAVRARVRRFCRSLGTGWWWTICPEIHGVNVTATLASVGVHLEWPPIRWTRVVALIGNPS